MSAGLDDDAPIDTTAMVTVGNWKLQHIKARRSVTAANPAAHANTTRHPTICLSMLRFVPDCVHQLMCELLFAHTMSTTHFTAMFRELLSIVRFDRFMHLDMTDLGVRSPTAREVKCNPIPGVVQLIVGGQSAQRCMCLTKRPHSALLIEELAHFKRPIQLNARPYSVSTKHDAHLHTLARASTSTCSLRSKM